jgi:putative Mg2+ transporter-C (MgtC) family protein
MGAIMEQGVVEMVVRLLGAGLIGAVIGFERRLHHKAIGVAGMFMVALGSTTCMLLASI